MNRQDENTDILKKEVEELKAENLYLKNELDKLKRLIFGSKSERFIPNDKFQLSLDLGIESAENQELSVEEISYKRTKNKSENRPVRQAIPSHLPRHEEIIEPDNIPEGAKKIGESVTEILEYKPGRLYVKKYIRPKYAPKDQDGIITG
ncbi:MAG: IS66 family transposase, partial [Desulfobacteraceae bacterium]|nr:IS66 family transposase [Desulfobacteraceae bacterium]